jgi:2-amino-4-hydroxy-6-hydroxymethyldihydropteridine diphosphokinase
VTDSPNERFIDADTMSGQISPIRRAVFSLGSNMGDRLANLQDGLNTLLEAPGIHSVAVSPVYETEPVGGPPQDAYLNAILIVDTDLSAHALLERALAVEAVYGRERNEHWGPRTLDIDIIVIGDRRADDADLQRPHPRAHERAFVLAPWLAIDPQAEIPGYGSIRDLLAEIGTEGVTAVEGMELKLPD